MIVASFKKELLALPERRKTVTEIIASDNSFWVNFLF